MKSKLYSFFLLVSVNFFICNLYAADILLSPNGQIQLTVSLKNQNLTYSLANDGVVVVSESPMGVVTSKEDFSTGLVYVSSITTLINETYQLPSGKTHNYLNNCNELDIKLTKNASEFHVILRAYNDGIAFRYYIPGSGSISINGETTGFAIANFDKSWSMKYANGYSDYYPARNWAQNIEVGKLAAPMLVKNNANAIWCLLTEAQNTGSYSSSTINASDQTGLFKLAQNGTIIGALPLTTPWRVLMVGDLATIVESVMIENLNPPSQLTDISWIKPGRASWDWGGEEGHPAVSNELAYSYIDLASSMGWEYYLQDDGWDNNATINLQSVINYATSKNVGVLLWSGASRFTNNESQIRTILSQWKGMGIKGVKIDFWNDDSQLEFQKYDKFLKVASEQNLLVDLHGCTKPSGLRRTWPNLVTSEAVLGGEMYLFNTTMTPANYNVTLTMTRNVIGPMDYTPLDFANKTGGIKQFNTWGHQLAMGVAFESGIQHMNDSPENYRYHIAKELLRNLPVAWDETKCLEAYPDKYVTIARKKGNDWYIASLSDSARALSIKLSFLDENRTYTAQIYKDGSCPSDIQYEQIEVKKEDVLPVALFVHGGVTIRISTTPLQQPIFTTYEAEAAGNTCSNGARVVSPDSLCSNKSFVGWIGNGGTLVIKNIKVSKAGNYNMTLYYMTGDTRDTYIKVNDQEAITYSFNGWGSYDGNGLAMRNFTVNLTSGDNSIEFGNATGNAINIDRIVISSVEETNTGIQTPSVQPKIQIYPTIAKDIINIKFVESCQSASIKVMNISGQTIYNKDNLDVLSGQNKHVDIRNSINGMYVVLVNSKEGSFVQKIIKNKF
jgi:alpha-glucosidase